MLQTIRNAWKIDDLRKQASDAFEKKLNDSKFTELGLSERVLALANIIKSPDLLNEICSVTLNTERKEKSVQKSYYNEKNELVREYAGKTTVTTFDFKFTDASLADYVPDFAAENEAGIFSALNSREINENENAAAVFCSEIRESP